MEWEIDQIITSRIHYGKLQYQVTWMGWDPDPEFYDAASFKNSPSKLREFHDRQPECEGPPSRLLAWEAAHFAEEEDPPHKDDNIPVETKGTRKLRRSARRK